MMSFGLGLVISLIMVVYVASDASRHGKSPWVWGIFALFFGFLALGIYLYQTQRKRWGGISIAIWLVMEAVSLVHGRLVL